MARRKKSTPKADPTQVQLQVGLTQTGHVRVAMVGAGSECQDGWGLLTIDLSPEEAMEFFKSFGDIIPISAKLRERPGLWIQDGGSA